MKPIVRAAITVAAMHTSTASADCSDVIKLSIVSASEFLDRSSFESSAADFCREYSEAKRSGNTGGLDIGFKGFEFGANSSSANSTTMASSYCEDESSGKTNKEAYKRYVRSVAPAAFESYNKCLEQDSSLSVSIGAATAYHVPFQVNFVPFSSGEYAEIEVVTDRTVSCDFRPQIMRRAGNISVTCSRENADQPGSISIINRAGGKNMLSIPWSAYTADGSVPVDVAAEVVKAKEELVAVRRSLLGAVVPFESETCPRYFEPYLPAQGRFIRGIDFKGETDSAMREPGSFQEDSIERHTHDTIVSSDQSGHPDGSKDKCGSDTASCSYWRGNKKLKLGGGAATSGAFGDYETRPKNVALLYCQFTGKE